MGLLDNLKARLGPAKNKVSDLTHQHEGKIQQGLDKAARTVDERTKGKYSDKIQSGTGKAKGAVGRLAHKNDPGAEEAVRARRRPRPERLTAGRPRSTSSAPGRPPRPACGGRGGPARGGRLRPGGHEVADAVEGVVVEQCAGQPGTAGRRAGEHLPGCPAGHLQLAGQPGVHSPQGPGVGRAQGAREFRVVGAARSSR
ncbi:hypothetical protein SHKM778_22860 [Streptomyces sp. KM77-8]|uniref:Antitoxin n=1 Tax=Streptomyces haneummycinicus TaxID=3074435 RepID=A0AAT9HEZ6_9ACTN